ncbi:translational GTPase TypA [Pseudomonadales bacterium]|nr:translational GTPase TypA [Pseudomonadales bacterium]MDA8965202.1 translational GTPase TypA [Pseudomonadales bacterium]MDB4362639.1 translational GTPase TypA [Pseudomonadales bacterium]MDB4420698.1 translational GTPase TypA [Pseudomonadales bacterium]MDB4431130.1 translational GTPase TypA [Pseudomonadales bacterium]
MRLLLIEAVSAPLGIVRRESFSHSGVSSLDITKTANLRNIAIIAHVDHGKTTLVDKLLEQSGTLDRRDQGTERIMDSNDQEKERGITILAKNTAINWNDHHINIVDTPGHADFGGEVERVLSMVDSVLLLVDAVDGPMPQTRFVTQKAFAVGLNPIVVINKIDRPGARADWVMDQVFDLFDRLGATDEQLDFPVVYASALNGIAGLEQDAMADDMTPLLQLILDTVRAPQVDIDGPFQMQISSLDYSSYVGVIGVGRIKRGSIKRNTPVVVTDNEGNTRNGRILDILGNLGVERVPVEQAGAGDIVCVTGLEGLQISETLCAPECIEALPALTVDEPTVSMTFQVNDSPFAGQDGKFVTSRNIKERLERELLHNVALRVEQGDTPDKFKVSGRGELHLSVLIETMRREGFEMSVGRPEVVQRDVDGVIEEPFEAVVVDCEEQHQGSVMEAMGLRRGDLKNMVPDGKGRIRLDYIMPARGLIGFRSEFLTMTSGTGILTSIFDHYGPVKVGEVQSRTNGVLISNVKGKTLAYALFNLQERGRLTIEANVDVYEGQVVGIHSRGNDLTVNPTKAKQLTNVRASGTDEATILSPHIKMTLEQALEFIEDDEMVEVTPNFIRVRKKLLLENERKRASRSK